MSDTTKPFPGERLIEILAFQLYRSTLIGNPSPAASELRARMAHPVPGDLVLELSTIWHEERIGTRLGRLVRVTEEPISDVLGHDPAEWHPDPVPTIRVWTIALADGREYRWHNANFITVPTNLFGYQTPIVSNPGVALASLTPAPATTSAAPTEPAP